MNKESLGWLGRPELAVPEEFRRTLEHQRERDLVARQKPGVIFYPVVWLIIAAGIMFFEPSADKAWWLSAIGSIIILSSLYRRYCIFKYSQILQQGMASPTWLLDHSLLLSAGSWGTFLAISLLPTPLSPHYIVIYTGTLALSAGGTASLSIKPHMVYLFLAAILAPAIVISFTGYSVHRPTTGLILLAYGAGMAWISRLPRNEYESAVVSNLKLSQQANYLTELTTLDGLTSLKNRRFFDTLLKSEIRRANRLDYPLSLLMIDIDHFKAINDQYGHVMGDACLVNTANALLKHIQRTSDVLARYGGEEFAIILPGAEQSDAIVLAETLRREVESVITWNLSQPVKLTISIGGLTAYPVKSMDPVDYLELADKALYNAKNSGRNRTCWAQLNGQIIAIDQATEIPPTAT